MPASLLYGPGMAPRTGILPPSCWASASDLFTPFRGSSHPSAGMLPESGAVADLPLYSRRGIGLLVSEVCGIICHSTLLDEVTSMLLRFGVANHRSIHDYQELFLTASKRIKREGISIPVPMLQQAAVPVAAIYGPNASGKSNLIDALNEIRRAIVRSHQASGATDPIPRSPFLLDTKAVKEPTRFDCTFTLSETNYEKAESDHDAAVYEYGFEFKSREFTREWLFRTIRKERLSTQTLFERQTKDGQTSIDFGSRLRGENKTIANLTRPNSLFLSAAAQNNHPQLGPLHAYFASRWKTILNAGPMLDPMVAESLSNYAHLEQLLPLVRQADLGISEIKVEEEETEESQVEFMREIIGVISKHVDESDEDVSSKESLFLEQMRQRKKLSFIHATSGEFPHSFEYGMQSKGTQTLISFLIPALEALAKGSLLVIDELDTSLHPDLTRAFVSLFGKVETNPSGAQLIFTTHDVTLLSSGLLSQDEVWISVKDNDGASHFRPLTDFKLRSRDDIERAYRNGRFGGVPASDEFIG